MLLTRSGDTEPDQRLSIVSAANPKSEQPEIILIASSLGSTSSYELDEEDVVALSQWLADWILRRELVVDGLLACDEAESECRTQFGPAAEMAARARDGVLIEEQAGCPECHDIGGHKMDCSRRRRAR